MQNLVTVGQKLPGMHLKKLVMSSENVTDFQKLKIGLSLGSPVDLFVVRSDVLSDEVAN